MPARIISFSQDYKFLFLIVFLALILRTSWLNYVPPSLNWDEASHGYNAYSILMTGKDEWGRSFPIIFRAYGDYKLPVYIYTTVLSVAVLGLNSLSVRLVSALAGVGIVIFTYFLVIELFKNNPVTNVKLPATLASLLVAVEPWSLFLSRGAFEANLSLFLFLVGVYFFLKSLQKPAYLVVSAFFLGLTVWTYNSYRIFTPLVLVILIILFKKEVHEFWRVNKTIVISSLSLLFLFLTPMLYQIINPVGLARYEEVEILDQGALNEINEKRVNSQFTPLISRLIYNKGTYFTRKFVINYFSHFSPKFLFFEGGAHYQFGVPDHGLIYPINSLFLIIGMLYLIRKKKKGSWFLLSWLLLAPIPSSLTREAPHVLRSIVFLPIPMILTSIGVSVLTSSLKAFQKGIAIMIYIILLAFFVENYLNLYFTEYRRKYSWSWQYGYKEMVDYVKSNYDKYDKIIVSKKYGEPHEFFLFYWPWDPESYQNDPNLVRFYQSNWYWVDSFDKFRFVNDWQVKEEGTDDYEFNLESKKTINCLTEKCLLITSPNNVPEGWFKLETINFSSGFPAFEIYDNSLGVIELL